jgi:hypothetical protein
MAKLAAIAALVIAATFWKHASDYELVLRLLISLAAVLVVRQAIRAQKPFWAAGFIAMMTVFNPFLAVISLSGKLPLFAVLASGAAFAASLAALKTRALLSIPSITDRTPGSESL